MRVLHQELSAEFSAFNTSKQIKQMDRRATRTALRRLRRSWGEQEKTTSVQRVQRFQFVRQMFRITRM